MRHAILRLQIQSAFGQLLRPHKFPGVEQLLRRLHPGLRRRRALPLRLVG